MRCVFVALYNFCNPHFCLWSTDSLGQSSDDSVVVDGNTITSQGPATTMAFSLKLVEVLYGRQKADEIAQGLLYTRFHNY